MPSPLWAFTLLCGWGVQSFKPVGRPWWTGTALFTPEKFQGMDLTFDQGGQEYTHSFWILR